MKHFNKNTWNKGIQYSLLPALLIMLGITNFAVNVQAQTVYKIAPGSRISVTGTSNLHAWSMSANTFTSDGTLLFKDSQLTNITALQFSLPVKNLKSKEDLMDSRAYKTLKAAEFTKITFRLATATMISEQKMIRATGSLTIAGKSNMVTIQTTYTGDADDVTLKGSRIIKMSDYGMKAPSFMLGALKTGNEVTVDFLLKLKKSDLTSITLN